MPCCQQSLPFSALRTHRPKNGVVYVAGNVLRTARSKHGTHSNGSFETVDTFERHILNTLHIRTPRSRLVLHSNVTFYMYPCVTRCIQCHAHHPLFKNGSERYVLNLSLPAATCRRPVLDLTGSKHIFEHNGAGQLRTVFIVAVASPGGTDWAHVVIRQRAG